MKFFKTKAVAALSITLLLSTQAKGMGHDAEAVLQIPMAQASVEVIQPSLKVQAKQAFSNAVNGFTKGTKSIYGVAMDNKTLVAAGAGLGAAGLAYKKYPKTAIATGLVSSAAIATDLTGKYSPETIQKGKELAVNTASSVATFAKDAGNYAVETGKSVANYVAANSVEAGKTAANFVVAHTPEFVKNAASFVEQNELQVPAIMVAGAAAYGAYKAYTPAKNVAKKAASSVAQAARAVRPHAKKIAVGTAVTGAVAAAAYYNQDALVAGKDAAVTMAKDVVNAVANVEYAKYGQKAVDAAVKQASKLKVNGARLVEAARNADITGMAKNAGAYIAEKSKSAMELAKETEVMGTAAVVGLAATGYGLNKAAQNAKKATPTGLEDIRNLFVEEPVKVKTDKNTAAALKEIAQNTKLNYIGQVVEQVPSIEQATNDRYVYQVRFAQDEAASQPEVVNPLNAVVLPGQESAPKLNVYEVPARELTDSVREAVDNIVQPIVERPVAQNVENIATMVSVLDKSVAHKLQLLEDNAARDNAARQELIERAMRIQDNFTLTSIDQELIRQDIAALKAGKGNLNQIKNTLDSIQRVGKIKNAHFAKATK